MARTVLEKLGHKPGRAVRAHGLPPEMAAVLAAPEPTDTAAPAVILYFVHGTADLPPAAERGIAGYRPEDRLWFCYPKKTGAIRTDISRDSGWNPLTDRGFLPVTQIALDQTWSALRFRPRAEIKVLKRRF